MKSTVLKYGIISGLFASILLFATISIQKKLGFGAYVEVLGYFGVALAFVPLYLGIRAYRRVEKDSITFWKALNAGILIIVTSGLIYAVCWLVTYYTVTPQFPEKYSAYLIRQIKISGKDLKDTITVKQQMVQYKEMTKNPFIYGAMIFSGTLPLGIILALICAAILRKKAPDITDAVVVEEEENPNLPQSN